MTDTLVFIPAWNEEASLPAVLEELRDGLPAVDVLVVDDGSTDRTAEVAQAAGAEVLSFGRNCGLRAGIAAGYAYAHEHGYAFAGRVDADGQHPVEELARLLSFIREGDADVAVGSRFATGDGYAAFRYRPSRSRRLGTAVLRRAMRAVLGRPFQDATSGMYAVNALAMPILAKPYESGAPEVESLLRLREGGLTVAEVPVHMRERASGSRSYEAGEPSSSSSPSPEPSSCTGSGTDGHEASSERRPRDRSAWLLDATRWRAPHELRGPPASRRARGWRR